LDLNALNETQKSVLFKAAQKLHAKQYRQLLRACLGNNSQALSQMKMQARETMAAKVRWSFS
jgi:hypothetical protein